MERKGMGVLVFVSGDEAATQEGIDFAYLTLGELRDYLSRFSDKNGFVYRWVKHAESVRGIPLVIIPPAGRMRSLRLSRRSSTCPPLPEVTGSSLASFQSPGLLLHSRSSPGKAAAHP